MAHCQHDPSSSNPRKSDPVPLSECRVLMVVDRPKEKKQQQIIQEAAEPHQIKVRSGALTVAGGRYFRQTDQRADWIACSSLETCFDENADKQPLDHLARRLPTLFFLFFSLLPAPQMGHYWLSCHLSWPADKGKRRDGFVYTGWNMSSQ